MDFSEIHNKASRMTTFDKGSPAGSREVLDFSNLALTGKEYGGSEPKLGVMFGGARWILKFRKIREGIPSYNHISEYLGSRIYEACGVPVQEVLLGVYDGNEVVALKDFVENGYTLAEFNVVDSTTLDHVAYSYTFSDIEDRVSANKKLVDKSSVITRFWRMFVIDAVLGNFDRHGCNWGYLLNVSTGEYSLAPVFDNGSCLFPSMREEDIDSIMNDKTELKKRIYTFPTSQILLNGNKSSYFDVIDSRQFEGCNHAVEWALNTFKIDEMTALVDSCSFISKRRRDMLKTMITLRYRCIIKGEGL